MTRIWTLALAVVISVILCTLALAACSSDNGANPSGGSPGSSGGGSDGGTGSCATPNTGCACSMEGELIQCGEVHGTTAAGTPNCEFGYRRCVSGQWSACEQLQNLTGQNAQGGLQLEGIPTPPVLLSNDAGCPGDPCDPYCMGFPEGGLPDGGITGSHGDGGGTGSMGLGVLAEAGVNVDAGIFHVLTPGQVAINPITVTTTLNPVDVYFLFNSTNEMYSSFETLASQMPSVVSTVEASIPNTAFGLGRFTNYASWPYQTQAAANTVYAPILGETTNAATVNAAFSAVNAGEFTSKPYVVAQSSGVALYSMALNQFLGSWAGFPSYYNPEPGSDYWYATTKWWGRGPLSNWYGYFYQPNSCPAGTLGAACFRQNAFHLVLLMQDSPMMNGPVGSFPYYQFMPRYFPNNSWADYTTENSWYWWDVKSPILGGTSGAPVQTETIAAATVGQPQTWMGSAFNNTSNYKITSAGIVQGATTIPYDASATMKCTWNGQNLGTGPDAEFDFTVTSANQRYWFDTVGSAYDTVLYLVNKTTNTVMACSDDNFAWLSDGGIGIPGQEIAQYNSAIVGTLQPGNYELVLDQNTANGWFAGDNINPAFYTGYQLNLWPDMTDPMVSGPGTAQNHSSDASTPGYKQMLAALATPGINAKVGAIEMSGVTCGQTATAWENNFTRWSMEGLANDTGAVAAGLPIVISVKQNGAPGPASGSNPLCPSASSLGSVVATAITELTNNEAQAITASVVDFDDATDYDGPPGGPVLYTPYNVNDATFVSSIVAQPVAGCTVDPTATFYTSCLPGSIPNFQFNFAVPTTPVAVVQSSVDQIFYFKIYLYGSANLATPLVTVPVVIIVPAAPYTALDYYEDFGADCPVGTKPVWGIFNWNATTPGNSAVDFLAAFGPTVAAVNAATDLSPPFEIAQTGPPNTDIGAFNLGTYATTNSIPSSDGYVRIHAQLRPTTDGTQAPTLTNMNLQVDCVPSE